MPQAYAGYHQRAVPGPDPELTAVGPETPCGEWMRRYWQPVAMASELGERPLLVKLLGEELVLFRDRSGRIGLLHKHCSHRGASLEFGIPMERGLSCCYHGWTYDVDGTILDTPAEPADSPIRARLVHGAYPVECFEGLIFAYLGPPEQRPAFSIFDSSRAGAEAVPFSIDMPCNWLQVYENTQDPVHVIYLHTRMSGAQFGDASGALQVITYRPTPLGMANVQTRRWGEHYWTRMVESILPNVNQTGAIWEAADRKKVFQRCSILRWMVPVADDATRVIGWRYFSPELDPLGQGDRSKVGKQSIDFIGQTEDRLYAERQRQPGDYEVQVSQRPVAVHALENLASSDQGVAMLRQLIRRNIRAAASGARVPPYPVGADGMVATNCQDTVWPVGPVATAEAEDRARLAAFGEVVADAVLASVELDSAGRRGFIETRVAEHLAGAARR